METGGKLRHPRDIVALAAQKLTHLTHKIEGCWREFFLRRQHRLAAVGPSLEHLSPLNVLGRGYALVQDAAGHIVASSKQLKKGDQVHITFQDGSWNALIKDE
jgi:exodeoxyribonuclease VII large subunit